MPPSASLPVPTSRQDALRILADTREPLGGSEFVLVAEYVTNEELLDQRRKTNPSIILNTMTTTLDNARDQYAVDHNQLPGTYRYDFKHRRCNNLEAALGKDHPSVRGLRQSTDRARKGDEWIPAGLSLNELAARRGNHTQPSPDALYGRLWEYHPDLNSQAENIRVAFNYQKLSSVYHFLCHVKRLDPVISRIMAASPPNAQPHAQPIPRNITARRTTVRKRVKLTPAPGLPGGHNYTLNTFDARAIASPGPLPLFASSPVLLSGATVPLPPGSLWPIPSAVTRVATSSTPGSLPSASLNSTQLPRARRPNLVDVTFGHAAGFDVVSWFPPMQGPVKYVTSIAALYIGLATGKNFRIIETRSESEMEELRIHAGDTMYR